MGTEHDILYDVGCGDGRVLIEMATYSKPVTSSESKTPAVESHRGDQSHHCKHFIGVEISQSRAEEAKQNVRNAKEIPPHVQIEIICANALDLDYSKATVIFLYLVPRGLRLIKPLVWPSCSTDKQINMRRIITYMAPFQNTPHVRKDYCTVGHQDGAAWPLYL